MTDEAVGSAFHHVLSGARRHGAGEKPAEHPDRVPAERKPGQHRSNADPEHRTLMPRDRRGRRTEHEPERDENADKHRNEQPYMRTAIANGRALFDPMEQAAVPL